MTFQEFQATRRAVPSIADALAAEMYDDPGHVYADALFILDHSLTPEGVPQYWTIIGRSEYVSADRSELEAVLYEWALTEGYAEPTDDQRQTLDRIEELESAIVDTQERDEFAQLAGELDDLRLALIGGSP